VIVVVHAASWPLCSTVTRVPYSNDGPLAMAQCLHTASTVGPTNTFIFFLFAPLQLGDTQEAEGDCNGPADRDVRAGDAARQDAHAHVPDLCGADVGESAPRHQCLVVEVGLSVF
jgi:hypothetical protein